MRTLRLKAKNIKPGDLMLVLVNTRTQDYVVDEVKGPDPVFGRISFYSKGERKGSSHPDTILTVKRN
jgi:hypothetical protein